MLLSILNKAKCIPAKVETGFQNRPPYTYSTSLSNTWKSMYPYCLPSCFCYHARAAVAQWSRKRTHDWSAMCSSPVPLVGDSPRRGAKSVESSNILPLVWCGS
ncbi:hypothetical protein TNCV_1842951 [Trichonephila clavipes]|nr:hypothetical protein TNCV_1842951 [Trichonephila clavipes]